MVKDKEQLIYVPYTIRWKISVLSTIDEKLDLSSTTEINRFAEKINLRTACMTRGQVFHSRPIFFFHTIQKEFRTLLFRPDKVREWVFINKFLACLVSISNVQCSIYYTIESVFLRRLHKFGALFLLILTLNIYYITSKITWIRTFNIAVSEYRTF